MATLPLTAPRLQPVVCRFRSMGTLLSHYMLFSSYTRPQHVPLSADSGLEAFSPNPAGVAPAHGRPASTSTSAPNQRFLSYFAELLWTRLKQ